MSTANADAVGMACCAALFIAIGAIGLRTQRRTGRRNQWVYVGPTLALVALALMIINLSGHAIIGGGGG